MTHEEFEKRWKNQPEPKLELIDGQLVVGNSLRGSRYVLHDILSTWGAEAAIPFARETLWRFALSEAFESYGPPLADADLADWQRWAQSVEFSPEILPAGPRGTHLHRAAQQRLKYGLFTALHRTGFAEVFGRDFVMRLGGNAFTPDVMVIGPSIGQLVEYYHDGPADLVMEVLLPGHEDQDRTVKRDFYAAARVPEYWIVDPIQRQVEFLVWMDGQYHREGIAEGGRYRSVALPGLAMVVDRLWQGIDEDGLGMPHLDPPLFEVSADETGDRLQPNDGGIRWGELPFEPNPDVEPEKLSFEEFISFCPEAKFEVIDGKPWIGGSHGTKHVLGMLLRNFGLREAVTVLHPTEWVTGLLAARHARETDQERREAWWSEMRETASMLRERFGLTRLAVIGDLTGTEPLNLWSDVTVVAFDVPKSTRLSEAYHALYERNSNTRIADLREASSLFAAQQQELQTRGVEL